MQRSRYTTLLWSGLAAAVVGWILGLIAVEVSGSLPAVLWVLIPVLLFMATLVFIGARLVSGWVGKRRYEEFVDALTVARLLALAKALAIFGAVVAGGYVGLGLFAADQLTGATARDRLLLALAVAACGLLVSVAGLRLERACEVPRPPREDEEGDHTNG